MAKHPPNEEHIDTNMLKVEVNLDDMTGEWLGFMMDRLLELGANDVFYTPIYMKKNRPAVLLQFLCPADLLEEMKHTLLTETTTFGFRYYPITVHRMERRFITVETKWGPVTVKQGIDQGVIFQSSPEYEDCKKIANQHQIPLKEVYQSVWQKL